MSISPTRAPRGIGLASDDEEEEDSSSALIAPIQELASPDVDDMADELARFRMRWQNELRPHNSGSTGPSTTTGVYNPAARPTPQSHPIIRGSNAGGTLTDQQAYEQAKVHFLQGVEFERKGMMHDAIRFYHAAVRLVPDIEKRIFRETSSRINTSNPVSGQDSPMSRRSHSPTTFLADDNGPEIDGVDLVTLFMGTTQGRCAQPAVQYSANYIHFGHLPTDITRMIFKWVVGSELDVRQLEVLSVVCRGFYLIARDPELWRLICTRTWGIRTGEPNDPDYMGSWRCMYVLRPHIWHNGVYISKITYIRHGETSFQDQFYRPWHLVTYYRYIRLFADGTITLLTTPEDPYSMVPFFKQRNVRYPGVYRGRYWLMGGDRVAARLTRQRPIDEVSAITKKRRDASSAQYDVEQHLSQLELRISGTQYRRNNQLTFHSYSSTIVYRDGHQMSSTFDINEQNFPPLYFSRVKSYSAESSSVLC